MFRRLFSVLWGRLTLALALTAVLSGSLVSASVQADGLGDTASLPLRSGRILGIQRPITAAPTSSPFLGSGKLIYHGGLVQHTNKVYAIYWIPSGYTVSANYVTLINRFFTDVAAASGQTSNVYFSDTQYYDTSGKIQYASTFAGSVIDTTPLPPNGCHDSFTSVCLTDQQIQTEVQNVIAAQGWTADSSTEFFMFTAKGIGSCFDSSNSECAFSTYCAYHSWISSGVNAVLYANMPYADTVPANCDVGQHPNNDDADATINVTSHEHNETITDPEGNAWYDRAGFENGDKCAWIFGTEKGTNGQRYNQVINGNRYLLQLEWSNATNRCVQRGT